MHSATRVNSKQEATRSKPSAGLPTTHIIVGTKAQFIKMAPIAKLLDDLNLPYRILDMGQHGSITPGILRDFKLSPDLVHVLPAGSTVATYSQAVGWVGAALGRLASSRQSLKAQLLRLPAEFALVHGDTLSTLLGLYLGRRLGLRVGLVEAGLSSGSLLDPFPEELVRRHVEARADILFAPDDWSANRLSGRGLKGRIVSTGYNTGRDALHLIARLHPSKETERKPAKTVLTLHRAETISRRSRLCEVIHHLLDIAPQIGPIRFFLHQPTKRALIRANLLGTLEANPHFHLCALGSYPEFNEALVSCQYVLTDGGSIQEEASYLGRRCLILRRTTERRHGLGTTAMLASMDAAKDLRFLETPVHNAESISPPAATLDASRTIVRTLYPIAADWALGSA